MISALLAGLIILLSLQAVDSLSVSSSRRSEPQLFTIPLQRRVTERTDIHPLMVRVQFSNCSEYRIYIYILFDSFCNCVLIAVFVDWQR